MKAGSSLAAGNHQGCSAELCMDGALRQSSYCWSPEFREDK